MYNGKKKIEENTEYSIRMPDGKVQKFAYYGEKENGRLILLNTRYGTLTSMGAAYFLKLISGKYPCTKRPYNVEYPEGYEKPKELTPSEKYKQYLDKKEKERDKEREELDIELLKWATRLKTLPDREAEILGKELKIAPHILGENLEKWANGIYEGPQAQISELYNKVQTLLKGTPWDVK